MGVLVPELPKLSVPISILLRVTYVAPTELFTTIVSSVVVTPFFIATVVGVVVVIVNTPSV